MYCTSWDTVGISTLCGPCDVPYPILCGTNVKKSNIMWIQIKCEILGKLIIDFTNFLFNVIIWCSWLIVVAFIIVLFLLPGKFSRSAFIVTLSICLFFSSIQATAPASAATLEKHRLLLISQSLHNTFYAYIFLSMSRTVVERTLLSRLLAYQVL